MKQVLVFILTIFSDILKNMQHHIRAKEYHINEISNLDVVEPANIAFNNPEYNAIVQHRLQYRPSLAE